MSYEVIFDYKAKDCEFEENVSSEPLYLQNFAKTLDDDKIIVLCNLLDISAEDRKYIRNCDDNSVATTDNFVNDYLYYKYKDTPNNALLLKEIFKFSNLAEEENYINSVISSRKKNNSANFNLEYKDWVNLKFLLYPSFGEKVCKWENIINSSKLLNQWEKEETINRYKSLDKEITKKTRFEELFNIIKLRNIYISRLDFINLLKKAQYSKKERVFITDCLIMQ